PRATLCPYTTLFRSPGAARHVDEGARGGPLAVEHVHDPGNELQAPAALAGLDVRLGVAAVDAHRPMVEGVLPLQGVLLCQEIARDRKSTRLNSSHVA